MVVFTPSQVTVELRTDTASYLKDIKAAEQQFAVTAGRIQKRALETGKSSTTAFSLLAASLNAAGESGKRLLIELAKARVGSSASAPLSAVLGQGIGQPAARGGGRGGGAGSGGLGASLQDAIVRELVKRLLDAIEDKITAPSEAELKATQLDKNVDALRTAVDELNVASKEASASAQDLSEQNSSLAIQVA